MERAELDFWRAKEVARLLALVEAERRYYQEIVARLPAGLVVVSEDLEVISANRAFRRLFGFRGSEVLRRQLSDVLPLEGLAGQVRELLQTGGSRLHLLYEPPGTPGDLRLRVSIASLRDWEDQAEREAMLLVEDLTEVRAPAAAPAEAVAPPADESSAVRWEADAGTLATRVLTAESAVRLLGCSPEECAAPDFWWRMVAPEDAGWVREFVRQAAGQTRIRYCDHRMAASGGGVVWVRNSLRPVLDEGGRVVKLAGCAIDITAVRAREEELGEGRILDAMAAWSARLTHDFNNLLMIVMGYGHELLDSLPGRDPRRGDLQEILRTAERVSAMVRELMTLSRPPVGEAAPLEVNAVLREMEPGLRILAGAGCEFKLVLDPDSGKVSMDPEQLKTAVTTLVRQAIRLGSESQPVTLETSRVELGADFARPGALPRSCVRLRVIPEGAQLDAETAAHLFEPLLSVKDPELAPGLFPICGIVRQAEGEIRVEREPGRSPALVLYLPRFVEAAAPAADSGVVEIQLGEAAETLAGAPPEVETVETPPVLETVLLVEDDAGIRALMRKLLFRQGYTVLEAGNGPQALRLAGKQSGPIHLLVTDLMMPEINGRQLAEQLMAQRPELKVIFVSGYSDDPMIQSGQLPEGAAFLQKPFTLGALLDKVRAMLGPEPPVG